MTNPTPIGSVGRVTDAAEAPTAVAPATREQDQVEWLTPLAGTGSAHTEAVGRLHALLLRATHYEVRRRASSMGLSGSSELEDLALQAADDALIAILARLERFERRSAFTTWAYKFAIHTAGVAVRQLAWHGREAPSSDTALAQLASHAVGPDIAAERAELLRAIVAGIARLTPRQREVMLTLCVSGVPIDVLAERLGATRGAVYKTLHDARAALRRHVFDPSLPTTIEGGPRHG